MRVAVVMALLVAYGCKSRDDTKEIPPVTREAPAGDEIDTGKRYRPDAGPGREVPTQPPAAIDLEPTASQLPALGHWQVALKRVGGSDRWRGTLCQTATSPEAAARSSRDLLRDSGWAELKIQASPRDGSHLVTGARGAAMLTLSWRRDSETCDSKMTGRLSLRPNPRVQSRVVAPEILEAAGKAPARAPGTGP